MERGGDSNVQHKGCSRPVIIRGPCGDWCPMTHSGYAVVFNEHSTVSITPYPVWEAIDQIRARRHFCELVHTAPLRKDRRHIRRDDGMIRGPLPDRDGRPRAGMGRSRAYERLEFLWRGESVTSHPLEGFRDRRSAPIRKTSDDRPSGEHVRVGASITDVMAPPAESPVTKMRP